MKYVAVKNAGSPPVFSVSLQDDRGDSRNPPLTHLGGRMIRGDVIAADPSPSTTLPKAGYADIRITKTADKNVASASDTLTYVCKLENRGNVEAGKIVLRDDLPEKFLLNTITAETDGTITAFASTDYSLDAENKLILPTATTKTISVPAAGSLGAGVTNITITGTITA